MMGLPFGSVSFKFEWSGTLINEHWYWLMSSAAQDRKLDPLYLTSSKQTLAANGKCVDSERLMRRMGIPFST